MSKSKFMVAAVLIGVFFFLNTVSVSADPAVVGKGVEQGFKYLFQKVGKKAAAKAMKKALKETGEEITYKTLEKAGREAAEKAFLNANKKAVRKFFEEGARKTGEKLPYTALYQANLWNEAAARAAFSKAKNEVVKEASVEVAEKSGRKTLSIISKNGIKMYLTQANNGLFFSANPNEALLIPAEMVASYSIYLQNLLEAAKLLKTVHP